MNNYDISILNSLINERNEILNNAGFVWMRNSKLINLSERISKIVNDTRKWELYAWLNVYLRNNPTKLNWPYSLCDRRITASAIFLNSQSSFIKNRNILRLHIGIGRLYSDNEQNKMHIDICFNGNMYLCAKSNINEELAAQSPVYNIGGFDYVETPVIHINDEGEALIREFALRVIGIY